MNFKEQIKIWLKEIVQDDDTECEVKYFDSNTSITLFTRTFTYHIEASKDYLGCITSERTPEEGEDWVRGSDLPDGEFNLETWNKIKNAIIKNELVNIPKKLPLNNNT